VAAGVPVPTARNVTVPDLPAIEQVQVNICADTVKTYLSNI
jgi:hypothetical protein